MAYFEMRSAIFSGSKTVLDLLMPAYRFCRPDDIPYLVRAVNECFLVHFPGSLPLTVDEMRNEMKELDLWPSNSMVAKDGNDPIAVLIGTKRSTEVLVLRLGVRPDHLRQGHGSHVLSSLRQKLAVLGPPRLIAEVPKEPDLAAFFTACGYRHETGYTDHVWRTESVEAVPPGLVMPVSVQDLIDNDVLTVSDGVAWERTRETLINSAEVLQGHAIASPERIEAHALCRPSRDGAFLDVVACGCVDPERRAAYLGILWRHLATASGRALRLPKLTDGELAEEELSRWGFRTAGSYERYASSASSG